MTSFLRRNAFPLAGALAIVVSLIAGFAIFGKAESDRMRAAHRVLTSASDIRLGLTIRHDRGAVVEEAWDLRDLDGVSTANYRIVGRNGETIRLTSQPQETTDVSFLFGLVVNDGIWKLPSRPPRGDTSTQYDFRVYQLIDGQHGSYAFHFTDPHYWATTGGHQMTIHLDKNTDVRDSLIHVTSETLVEDRYQKLIDDFEAFGSDEFRAKVAASRIRVARPLPPRA